MTTATQDRPANNAAVPATQDEKYKATGQLLMRYEQSLKSALPSFIPPNYMIRAVLTAVQRAPELLDCYPLSLLGAVFQCSQLGLVPDGVLGQAYLVPYKNRKKSRKEVQFIPGYKGLITLVRRSGDLSTIDAEVVYAKDTFSYTRGTNPTLVHEPYDGTEDPGPIVKVWAAARLKDGGFQIKVMNVREVEAIKKRSAAVQSGYPSPWDTDPAWMFKKTCLKQLCKLLPTSVEVQKAIALDDRAEVELPQDLAMLADENETATPVAEGEVVEAAASVQMPQRKEPDPPATAKEPEPPAEPKGDIVAKVEPVEFQRTRGKDDAEVARLGLKRLFFWLIYLVGHEQPSFYTLSEEIKTACEAHAKAGRPVEIRGEKDQSQWPKLVEVTGP